MKLPIIFAVYFCFTASSFAATVALTDFQGKYHLESRVGDASFCPIDIEVSSSMLDEESCAGENLNITNIKDGIPVVSFCQINQGTKVIRTSRVGISRTYKDKSIYKKNFVQLTRSIRDRFLYIPGPKQRMITRIILNDSNSLDLNWKDINFVKNFDVSCRYLRD